MVDIYKVIEESEKKIDKLLLSNEKLIARSIGNIEKKVIDLLPSGKKDKISFARATHKEMVKTFGYEWEKVDAHLQNSLSETDKLILRDFGKMEIPTQYTIAEKKTLELLKQQVSGQWASLGIEAQNRLAQEIYDYALGASDFSTIMENITGILSGAEYVGRSVLASAQLFAHDSLMGYYSRVNFSKADGLGFEKWLYYGNIMAKTRNFCKKRAGKVFSTKEIKSWEKLKWNGKRRGNIFFVRGGYNCRHTFRPVLEEWVEEDEKKE